MSVPAAPGSERVACSLGSAPTRTFRHSGFLIATMPVREQDRDGRVELDIGRQVLGALTLSSNWVEVVAGTDYFDRSTDALRNPL